MTIDGFLQFLGLVVAVYALFSIVVRYQLRLHGWWLWLPSTAALIATVYLLLFDLLGVVCSRQWCRPFVLPTTEGLTPNTLSFLVVLSWLGYVALLSRFPSIRKGQLPLLAALVDRLVGEKRLPELVDFVEPHIHQISRCAGRQFPLQKLRDRIRWHGNPFLEFGRQQKGGLTRGARFKETVTDWGLALLKRVLPDSPEPSRMEEAAQRILRVLHTNGRLVEFIALERPLFALKLMDTRTFDHDFSDRAFDMMMAHPESQLRRETLLNQSTERCFYIIDPKNPLIHALFADTNVAEKLQVWRPVGNYPLRLLERNINDYRQIISASKPYEDQLLHQDPTYIMIRFFDIMIRSAMRDGLSSHMWLMYFDILVDKLLRFMDRDHPDYDPEAEFPNFGYYLIYEVFHTYGEWLRAIECCPEDSPAVQIKSTAPQSLEPGIAKWTMVSLVSSLKYLISSRTDDRFVSYIIEVVMHDYKNLTSLPNGDFLKKAFKNQLVGGGEHLHDPSSSYGARFKRCYDRIDHCMKYDTRDFEAALLSAYP